MFQSFSAVAVLLCFFLSTAAFAKAGSDAEEMYWIGIKTKNKFDRSAVANLGVSIENVVDDMSYGFAPESIIKKIETLDWQTTKAIPLSKFQAPLDFPSRDSEYHNYTELVEALRNLQASHPNLVSVFSIGKTHENRDLLAVRLNPESQNPSQISGKPAMILVGGHHAREHLSVEIPLLFAQYLAANYGNDTMVTRLLDTREIFIVPNLNPDGSEYDIATGNYRSWRKNRKAGDRCAGVDLNRNYSFKFDSGGSSNNPCSDTYHGGRPFTEPETQAFKRFVESRHNTSILVSMHTFSELILYPWGHTYDSVTNDRDKQTFTTMANRMAQWNGYRPQQSSELYIASGVTQDWAYGDRNLIAFTFELSPRSMWNGGFYPGADAIQTTFQANLRPLLYMFDLADNPARSHMAPETTLFYSN